MKKSFLMIAAALFVLAGCQKEDFKKESKTNNVIHVDVKQMGPATRVIADAIDLANTTPGTEVKFEWEKDDLVGFMNAKTYEVTTFKCTNPTTNEFVKDSGDELDPAGVYFVAYPASFCNAYISILINGTPYDENYSVNQIPKEHPIIHESVSGGDTEFSLSQHVSIIHFKLKGTAKIGRIDYLTDDTVRTVLKFNDGVPLNNDTPIDVYMDIVAVAADGFKLKFFDASDNLLYEESTNLDMSEYDFNTIIDFDKTFTLNAPSN